MTAIGVLSQMPHEHQASALIFRRRLLPWSETFIANQGKSLQRYHPVFVGFNLVEAGEEYLSHADRIVLEDHALLAPLAKLQVKKFGRLPSRWARELRSRHPRLIHAHFGSNASDADVIAQHLDLPLVVTYHGADIAVRGGEKTRALRHHVFESAALVVAVSQFIAARLREAGCPPDKIRLHHIGVDTSRFRPSPTAERAPDTILFVGRLVEKKGLPHLLRALDRLRGEFPEAKLLVVGDGPLRAGLEAQARSLGVRATFLGVRPPEQVMALMQETSFLCAPSIVAQDGDAEGLPMTIVEAQASGLPVVCFASGGSSEGVAHNQTGFVAPPADEDALTGYLAQLLGDAPLRERFGEAARARALEQFDLARQARLLEEIYDEVVADRRTRP